MEITTIDVERRSERGRRQIARLRSEGKVPAVLYGRGGETVSVSVSEREVERHFRQHHKVFKLRMGGEEQPIYLQEVQWDPLTDQALHLDFLRIDLTKPLHVVVEIAFLGHPVGLGKGGRLIKDVSDIKLVCLPHNIPDLIELKIGDLDLGQQIHARDLPLPEGVSLDVPEETVICHLTVESEAPAEAPAEGTGEAAGGEGAGEPEGAGAD